MLRFYIIHFLNRFYIFFKFALVVTPHKKAKEIIAQDGKILR